MLPDSALTSPSKGREHAGEQLLADVEYPLHDRQPSRRRQQCDRADQDPDADRRGPISWAEGHEGADQRRRADAGGVPKGLDRHQTTRHERPVHVGIRRAVALVRRPAVRHRDRCELPPARAACVSPNDPDLVSNCGIEILRLSLVAVVRDDELARSECGGEEPRGLGADLEPPGAGYASGRALARRPRDDVAGRRLRHEPAGSSAGEIDSVRDDTRNRDGLRARRESRWIELKDARNA